LVNTRPWVLLKVKEQEHAPMAYNNRNPFINGNSLIDESPDYWQKNQEFEGQLKTFYHQRKTGQLKQEFREYAIPKSQMAELRVNPANGIPIIKGGNQGLIPLSRTLSRLSGLNEGAREVLQGLDPYSDMSSMDRDVDVTGMMRQRMSQQGQSPAMMAQQGFANMPAQGTGGRTVSLIEGHTFYRPLQVSGFPTSMPIVRTGGTIAGIQGQVELKEMKRVYNADGLARIDAQVVQQDTGRHMDLVVVQGTWTNGPVLVSREAIVENGFGNSGNQQLLQDGRQRQLQQQVPQSNFEQRMMIQHQQQQQASNQQLLLQQQRPMNRPMPQQQQPRVAQIDQSSRDLLRKRGLLKG
jgi:hypothetical protein